MKKRFLVLVTMITLAVSTWADDRTLISYTFTADDVSNYGSVDEATSDWVNSNVTGGTVSFFWKKGEGYCRKPNSSNAYTFTSGKTTPSIKLTLSSGTFQAGDKVTVSFTRGNSAEAVAYYVRTGYRSETNQIASATTTVGGTYTDLDVTLDNNFTSNTIYIEANTTYTFNARSVTVTRPEFAVTLDGNGGSANGAATVHMGDALLTISSAPTYTGYSVEGYYTEASEGTKVANADGTLVANVNGYTNVDGKWAKATNTTLYTHWTVNKTAPTYTAPAYSALTYNGSEQELVSAGSTEHGTIKYSTAADGVFSTNIPTGTNAGSYTVFYKLEGDAGHTDIPVTEVTGVLIAKYNIENATAASSIADQTHTGSQITPDYPAIKMGETTIDADNYEVSYGANTDVGTGTITYTAKEGSTNFKGTKTLNFNIVEAPSSEEKYVNAATTWTFDNYATGDLYSGNTSWNENGKLYARSISSRKYTITEMASAQLTFSDNHSNVTVSKYAQSNSATSIGSGAQINTAGKTNTSEVTPCFAFNAQVPGTCYAIFKGIKASTSPDVKASKCRIFFAGSGDTKPASKKSTDVTDENEYVKISWTSTAAGAFYIGSADNSCSIYAIRFAPTRSITISDAIEHGTVSVNATAEEDETVTLTIVPDGGYELDALTVKDASNNTVSTTEVTAGTEYTFTMPDANVTVTATFKAATTPATQYTLTIGEMTNGKIQIGSSDASTTAYNENTELTLTAVANSGYELDKWTDGSNELTVNDKNIVSVNGNTLKVRMTKNFTVVATFKIAETPAITVQKPNITVNDPDSYTYTISYQSGTTLLYTLPGEEEKSKTGGTSIDVTVTKLGRITAYETLGDAKSDAATKDVYVPTPAIAKDGLYEFADVKESMGRDYTLGTNGKAYGDAVTIGSVTVYKPDATVSKTLDRFAFGPDYSTAADWMLLSAGRLRAKNKSKKNDAGETVLDERDDYLAILDLKKGEYVSITYSGAPLILMSESTAKMAETLKDTLKAKTPYEVTTAGHLLLKVPPHVSNCDITVISISDKETVSAPTLQLRDGTTNVVTLRLGTSSFGKKVTAYYTTDGSDPTTSSTAVEKTTNITLDESCIVKAYCVSETGKASTVTELKVDLEASGKSTSAVYEWSNIMNFGSNAQKVYYSAYNSNDKGWKATSGSGFVLVSSFDNKISVNSGEKGVSFDTSANAVRLTQPMAIHNLGVGDEIIIIYTGDGSLYSAYDDHHDVFTIDGKSASAGTEILSGATIKVTKTMYSNNYLVVTPRGAASGKVYITAVYINHATPGYTSTPKVSLYQVNGEEAVYRFTFSEGSILNYILEKEGTVLQGNSTGIYDLTIDTSDKVKAWAKRGTVVSDTLKAVLYAPTPAPTDDGDVDFTEASQDLPADLEVTLDPNKPVTVGGETLYKPSALTAATFGDKFAFTETGSSNKIRIRTNRQLAFSKGADVNMGLLNLKKGDIVAFEYTGSILMADPSALTVDGGARSRAGTRAESNELTSGQAYVVQNDGNVLLTVSLAEASTSIAKMYIAPKPSPSEEVAIDFATAHEEYEDLDPKKMASVWYNGKTSAQIFYRLANDTRELPIDGKVSTEGGAGEITNSGIKVSGKHIAIHNLAKGDEIQIRFYGGTVTYDAHEEKGDVVCVDGKRLAVADTLSSGDVLKVEAVDYLNNYVVLKLDSKVTISGIFINHPEIEKVWTPTLTDLGNNVILISAGRSSMGREVTTCYTTDGSDPTPENGTSGPYEEFEVILLDGDITTIKAISYSTTGLTSRIASIVVFADNKTSIPAFTMDENGNRRDVYDLMGRKVNAMRRGQIYIVNGKKYFCK